MFIAANAEPPALRQEGTVYSRQNAEPSALRQEGHVYSRQR